MLAQWTSCNIFNFKKADGTAYLAFYILLPVIITVTSLKLLSDSNDNISIGYCYVTIAISAMNCIYDAANRWDSTVKSVANTKIFIILLSCTIVVAYSVIVAIVILITHSIYRCDCFLFFYFFAAPVALVDIFSCFLKEMAWKPYVKIGGAGE